MHNPCENLCIVALGANLPSSAGPPEVTLREAASRLFTMFAADDRSSCRLSSLYRSEPTDCPPDTPDFTNAIAILPLPSIDPQAADAQDFLRQLLHIEAHYGRDRSTHPLSRPLDLDLIAYGSLITRLTTPPPLTLPLPQAHLRPFVLHPLTELLPDYCLPGTSATAQDLLRRLPTTPEATRIRKKLQFLVNRC